MKFKMWIAFCGVMVVLALPALALAQSPTQSVYGGTGANQVSQVTQSSQRTLPFTGINLAVVGAVGAVLLGTGFLLRRSSRASTR
jgi:hypothetical protein